MDILTAVLALIFLACVVRVVLVVFHDRNHTPADKIVITLFAVAHFAERLARAVDHGLKHYRRIRREQQRQFAPESAWERAA